MFFPALPQLHSKVEVEVAGQISGPLYSDLIVCQTSCLSHWGTGSLRQVTRELANRKAGNGRWVMRGLESRVRPDGCSIGKREPEAGHTKTEELGTR